ncbi:hypothetical protein [Nocardia brasiliensis]|uniref:hypothetical protein n=1 Tax=Nocardia brasiliensis TaxID=37326 RepID=UPI002455993C|nr:hypothetical protein [Nocardia brasiliensis]
MADATPHGTINAYQNHHCRCSECRAAKARYMRELRAKNARTVVNGVHPRAPHGTVGGYDTYCCRCVPCKHAKQGFLRKQYERRLAERVEIDGRLVHPNARHGTSTGYRHYGCRCAPCRAAETARQLAKRHRRTAKEASHGA